MDQTSETELNRIRKTPISALTEADKNFLRARSFYLGKRDKKKYADIFDKKVAKIKVKGASNREMKRLAHPAAL